jgi:hypothetical protein
VSVPLDWLNDRYGFLSVILKKNMDDIHDEDSTVCFVEVFLPLLGWVFLSKTAVFFVFGALICMESCN